MEHSAALHQDSSTSLLDKVCLVATDMDGTLTQDGQFTAGLLQTLGQLSAANVTTLIVTGRSAGWVQGILAYLPIAGAIAENGGVYLAKATLTPEWLVDLVDIGQHRAALATCFQQLQQRFSSLRPAADNRFRLTDWTFDIGGLTPADLDQLQEMCQTAGWGFTYSTVQCHIRPAAQDKGVALQTVLRRHFPTVTAERVVTVGDSPNDEGLFNPQHFPLSVGVANVAHYRDRLRYFPQLTTAGREVQGFQELVQAIVTARSAVSGAGAAD